MRTTAAILICLLSATYAAAEPEIKGTPSELELYLTGMPQTVSITGTSEIKVRADKAIIQLKVTTEDKSLQKALNENQKLRNQIVEQLKKQGIKPDNITISRFSSTPHDGFWNDTYIIENSVRIAVSNESDIQKAADIIDNHEEVSFVKITFEHSQTDELKQKALAQACQNAQAKKKTYEENLKVKLKIYSFYEQAIICNTYYSYDEIDKNAILINQSTGRKAPITQLQSQFDELIFASHVTVEFELID
ncbi:MAG: SIMPL domain-containing protein [Sedimentisphaerales bacterium]|nr:SIMPL domain-containing protein [Sedimentisphaerales bacterium]